MSVFPSVSGTVPIPCAPGRRQDRIAILYLFLYTLFLGLLIAGRKLNLSDCSHVCKNIFFNLSCFSTTFTTNDFHRVAPVFGLHFYPIAWLYGLLLRGVPNFAIADGIQALAVAFSAWPLYRIARTSLAWRAAPWLLLAAYSLYFLNLTGTTWATGLAATATFPATFAWYSAHCGRYRNALLWSLVTLTFGEINAPFIVGLGLWCALIRGERRFGAVIAAAGLIYFVLSLKLAVWVNQGQFLYGPESDLARNALFHPLDTLRILLLSPGHPSTLARLLLPLLLLPLFSPLTFSFLFVPTALFCFVGRSAWKLEYGYGFLPMVPVLFYCAILGIRNLRRPQLQRVALLLLPVAVLVSFYLEGMPAFLRHQCLKRQEHSRVLYDLAAAVPQHASVCTQENLTSLLAFRKSIFGFDGYHREEPDLYFGHGCDFTLLDFHNARRYHFPDELLRFLWHGAYRPVVFSEGIALLRRNAPVLSTSVLLADPARIKYPANSEPVPGLRFLGSSFRSLGHDVFWFPPKRIRDNYHVTLYWTADTPQTCSRVYKIKIAGRDTLLDYRPFYGLYPETEWKPGEIIKDETVLVLPSGSALDTSRPLVEWIRPDSVISAGNGVYERK